MNQPILIATEPTDVVVVHRAIAASAILCVVLVLLGNADSALPPAVDEPATITLEKHAIQIVSALTRYSHELFAPFDAPLTATHGDWSGVLVQSLNTCNSYCAATFVVIFRGPQVSLVEELSRSWPASAIRFRDVAGNLVFEVDVNPGGTYSHSHSFAVGSSR